MLLRPAGFLKKAAAGGGGGITVEGVTTQIVLDSATNPTNVTIPGTPAENDIVLVLEAQEGSVGGFTQPTGYTSIFSTSTSGPSNYYGACYKRMGASPDSVVAIIPEGGGGDYGDRSVIVMLIRGVDTTTAEDATHVKTTGTTHQGLTSVPPDDITTVTNGALVVTLLNTQSGNGSLATDITVYPSGYTNTAKATTTRTRKVCLGVASNVEATAGTISPGNWTRTGSSTLYNHTATLAFRPA